MIKTNHILHLLTLLLVALMPLALHAQIDLSAPALQLAPSAWETLRDKANSAQVVMPAADFSPALTPVQAAYTGGLYTTTKKNNAVGSISGIGSISQSFTFTSAVRTDAFAATALNGGGTVSTSQPTKRNMSRPNGPAGGSLVPVGDAILPLCLMIIAYVCYRRRKQRLIKNKPIV